MGRLSTRSTEGRAAPGSSSCGTPLARQELLLPNTSEPTCLQVSRSREARRALPAWDGWSSIALAVPEPSPPRSLGATKPWGAQSPQISHGWAAGSLKAGREQGQQGAQGMEFGATGWLLPSLPRSSSLHSTHTKPASFPPEPLEEELLPSLWT